MRSKPLTAAAGREHSVTMVGEEIRSFDEAIYGHIASLTEQCDRLSPNWLFTVEGVAGGGASVAG